MRYREHRGALVDSMSTMVELPATKKALSFYINLTTWRGPPSSIIKVEAYGCGDARIGWDEVYIVTDQYGVVGFTDTMPE